MRTLGDRIDAALKEKGAIQAELAAACGITSGAITQWKSGKTKMNAASAIRAAAFLGVTPVWLTEGTGPMRHTGQGAPPLPAPPLDPIIEALATIEAEQPEEAELLRAQIKALAARIKRQKHEHSRANDPPANQEAA